MGEEASETFRNPDMPNVKLLDWISSKISVTREHIEGAGAVSVIVLTGFVAAYVWKKSREKRANVNVDVGLSATTSRRSQILGALHGGNFAIKRILDTRHASEPFAAKALKRLREITKENRLNFIKLQNLVGELEMTRKEDEGLKLLSKALENVKKRGLSQEAYELDMLIVEMLIYKGDFEGALRRKCLQEKDISDARRPLYQTIVYILLRREEVKESWLEYQDLRGRWRQQDPLPDSQEHPIQDDYKKFKKAVKFLGEEIQKRHKKK